MTTLSQIVISNKLRSITEYHRELMQCLSPNTILCGGLVLQALTCQDWDSDIDIFTTDASFVTIPLHPSKQYQCMLRKVTGRAPGYQELPGITDIYRGTIKGVNIDIIHVTSFEELFKGFDMDFCQVYFDGTEIHVNHPSSVLTKSCTIDLNAKDELVYRKLSERIKKYTNRGFRINVIPKNGPLVDFIPENT